MENSCKRLTLHVQGLDCPNEEKLLRKAFQGREGVRPLAFDLIQGRMTVEYDPARVQEEEIHGWIASTGMKTSRPQFNPPRSPYSGGVFGQGILRESPLLLVAAGLLLLSFGSWVSGTPEWITETVLAGVLVSSAWKLAPKVWMGFRALRFDMHVLMAIAVAGAIGLGEWSEAAIVAFLFALSQELEKFSIGRAQSAIESLIALSPATADVIRDSGIENHPVEDVLPGERILVRPGARIALDGKVMRGSSYVNEAPITGESVPVPKGEGSTVYAGSLNQDGSLEIQVDKRAHESTLARVIELVDNARTRRAPVEHLVDRFARVYTPAVIALAVVLALAPPLLGGLWPDWIYRAMALLLISCPCALVISTPVSLICALTSAARNGILIKGGAYLEETSRTRVVAFDKTGTLTSGRLRVAHVVALNGQPMEDVIRLAAAVEHHSQHPLARAVGAYAETSCRRGVPEARDFISFPGRGAMAEVEGRRILVGNHRFFHEKGFCSEEMHERMVLHEQDERIAVGVAADGIPLGAILIEDTVRPEAAACVRALKNLNISRVILLSGDNAGTARKIADDVGIEEVHAELLPQDKASLIEELARQEGHVLMAGDGVNDAPALAAATVGIAMGAIGADVALETAPVALMNDDLGKIPWLICHSRRTVRIIGWNIGLALGMKMFFVLMAILGWATLWMAILADMGTSLLVTFNGMRLLKGKTA
ncbi:MAG: cation-translocating P-type ATPase [Candidatus Omnitrophica bacterium]|nr:cation-translocating P-type ATPase [Candidatus Omnitrophota bacterium]